MCCTQLSGISVRGDSSPTISFDGTIGPSPNPWVVQFVNDLKRMRELDDSSWWIEDAICQPLLIFNQLKEPFVNANVALLRAKHLSNGPMSRVALPGAGGARSAHGGR